MSLTHNAREFFRKVYDVHEAKGDTIEVGVGSDGRLHVDVVKAMRSAVKGVRCEVRFKR